VSVNCPNRFLSRRALLINVEIPNWLFLLAITSLCVADLPQEISFSGR
jgi:hypothetical protein